MTNQELQKVQKEFAQWLKTIQGVHSTGMCKNSKGEACLCVYHTPELGTHGKKKIATEMGDIPIMFEETTPDKVKGAFVMRYRSTTPAL